MVSFVSPKRSSDQTQAFRASGLLFWIRVARLTLLLFCFTWTQVPIQAWAGSEYTRGSDTVRMTIDSRWPGNSHGGYVPLRIKLTNLGAEQSFRLVFARQNSGTYDRMPEVRRTVHLDQNATRDLTLPIPMVSFGNSGELKIYDGRGQEIEELRTSHTFPAFGNENARTSMLIITSEGVDEKGLDSFEDAAATECASIRGLMHSSGGSRYSTGQIEERDHLIIPPVSLPENWTDYSGIELIAISWPDLKSKLRTTQREAILNWTACGGVLIIYETEKPAAELEGLHQILELNAATGKQWSAIDTVVMESVITTANAVNTGVKSGRRGAFTGRPGGTAEQIGEIEQSEDGIVNHWIAESNAPTYRDWSFGRIYVFPKNPFPGTATDWVWLLASMPQNQTRWSSRLGMSARAPGVEFLNFLIPGVGSVPVHAFLILITIFTIVIGPLNYYWLRKQRRLGALVFTVPAIASVACVLLFFYSLMADGFSTRSRVQSVTYLDQQTKSAASLSRICLYAPFAPSAGLKFSASVAAFPIWPEQQRFEGGVVDWTGNEQHLTSGWFRSQTWTQFLTIEQRDERGRLDFTPPASADARELTVSNGFSWALDYLAIEPTPGKWYAGENIPAGATAQLKQLDSNQVSLQFSKRSKTHAWSLPEGLKDANNMLGSGMYGPGGYRGGRYSMYGFNPSFSGTTSLSDGQLRRFQNGATMIDRSPVVSLVDWRNGQYRGDTKRHTDATRPHFWAICAENPGVEIGIKDTLDESSYHLLFGVF